MATVRLDGRLHRWELRRRNGTPARMPRCKARRTERETRPPPPPPMPPPPPPLPSTGLGRSAQRRQEVNRRDTVLAGLASVGFVTAFVGLINAVKAPVDKKPPGEVTVTRIRRNERGLAFVQSKGGDWLLLKVSSRNAGLIYLRDRLGCVYRLQVTGRVQVDLSDDKEVLALFGDGKWESSMEQLQTKDGRAVTMTEDTFRKMT